MAALPAATPAPGAGFSLGDASVKPRKAFFDARRGVAISFRFSAPGSTDLSVRIAGAGAGVVRRFELAQLESGRQHELSWDGLTGARRTAPDGTYRVLVGPPGSPPAEAGRVRLRGHRYPVRGPHRTRGPVGEFGAGRSGGRSHEGFDVVARCGTRLVAARGGTVIQSRFHPRLDGNFVVIAGRKERRTYRYSHLIRPSRLRRGDRVRTGDLIGHVGNTGNARSTPCHLHFEIRVGRRFIDPEPELRRWDRFS